VAGRRPRVNYPVISSVFSVAGPCAPFLAIATVKEAGGTDFALFGMVIDGVELPIREEDERNAAGRSDDVRL
jgi:hypothetical protein